MLKVALPNYLNSLFLADGFKHASPAYQIERSIPTVINTRFAKNLYDFALISSVEVLKNNYPTLPYGIVSQKEVLSVNLYTKRAPKDLDGITIALTTESATSALLLKVLAHAYFHITPKYALIDESIPLTSYEAFLLIGDSALRHLDVPNYQRVDLAKVWFEWTNLPFVFAFFAISKDAENNSIRFSSDLDDMVHISEMRKAALIDEAVASSGFSKELLNRYFSLLSYRIGGKERASLTLFNEQLLRWELL